MFNKTSFLDDNDYKSPLDIICEGFLICNKKNNDENIITIDNSDYNIFSSILASIIIPINEISEHLMFYYCKQNKKVTEPFPIFLYNKNYAYYPTSKESLSIIDEKNNSIKESELVGILDKSSIDYKKRINVSRDDVPTIKLKEILFFSKYFPYDDISKEDTFIDFYTLFIQDSIKNNTREDVYLNLFLFCYIFKINYDFPDKHYEFNESINLQDIKLIKKIIFDCFTGLQRGRTVNEIYTPLINGNYDKRIKKFFSSFIRSLKEHLDNSENKKEVIDSLIEKINKNEH